jgi:hypothetical protein
MSPELPDRLPFALTSDQKSQPLAMLELEKHMTIPADHKVV